MPCTHGKLNRCFVWALVLVLVYARANGGYDEEGERDMSDFATRTTDSGVVVVQPTGRLNMTASPTLRKQLSDIVEGGGNRIVVDLSDTEFIDSSGLGALVASLKIAREAGGDLRIAAPTPQICTVLELSNLDQLLHTYDSADSAFDE